MKNHTATKRRTLGFWMCTALVTGNMVGTGIYMLPASLAPYGLTSLLGWIFTSIGAIFLAIVFATLSRRFPQAGGPYVYPRVAFGEAVGFIVAWAYWMSICVGNAAIATGTVSYLSELIPLIKQIEFGPTFTTCLLIWFLTYINWLGVRTTGQFQILLTVLKLIPFVGVFALALLILFGKMSYHIPVSSHAFTFDSISSCAVLTLWAFLGLESATIPSDNCKTPEKTIPRATLFGTLAASVIYIVTCSTIIMLIPKNKLENSSAPFADVVSLFWGDGASIIIALFAFISGFGALNGWIMLQSKIPCVFAEENIFPKIFMRKSTRYVPTFSLLFTSVLVTAFILMNYAKTTGNTFTFLILIATSVCLFMYFFSALALLVLTLRGKMNMTGKNKFLTCLCSLIVIIYSCWALYGAGIRESLWALFLLISGLPIYFILKWKGGGSSNNSLTLRVDDCTSEP